VKEEEKGDKWTKESGTRKGNEIGKKKDKTDE
jgi:hypothetical protein